MIGRYRVTAGHTELHIVSHPDARLFLFDDKSLGTLAEIPVTRLRSASRDWASHRVWRVKRDLWARLHSLSLSPRTSVNWLLPRQSVARYPADNGFKWNTCKTLTSGEWRYELACWSGIRQYFAIDVLINRCRSQRGSVRKTNRKFMFRLLKSHYTIYSEITKL